MFDKDLSALIYSVVKTFEEHCNIAFGLTNIPISN